MADMAEAAHRRRAALAHLDLRPSGSAKVGVRMAEVPHLGKLSLRGSTEDQAFLDGVAGALGGKLPLRANTSVSAGGFLALWLGPDEWLLITPAGEEGALAASLAAGLAGIHSAVVDVTDNSTTLRLLGSRVRDVLAKGVPIDLHPREFPVGKVVQTLCVHADVILHRRDDESEGEGEEGAVFELTVRRSFAEYVWLWLEDAGQEFGVAVDA